MPSAPSTHPSGLWEFSLDLYARPGVANQCLQLQDEQGVNVNLLLWCAWLDARGLILDAGRLHSAQKRIRGWDEHYVVPLRQLRRRMKVEFGVEDASIEAVRTQIKQAELLAEKQLQLWLESLVSSWDDHPDHGIDFTSGWSNVRFYLHHLSVTDTTITQLLELFGSDC
ncbi:MAG: TIGR02444 family protein [Cellvibrio sp.]|uniref:TIGR02444 family protein n=1 Tax=Cellvibrio sp. TaxID=1965322 RepID=UPI0031AAFFB4